MEVKRNRLNLKHIIIAILFGLLLVAGSLLCVPTTAVRADATQYTDVITDLKKDDTFNIADYPAKGGDYGIDACNIELLGNVFKIPVQRACMAYIPARQRHSRTRA